MATVFGNSYEIEKIRRELERSKQILEDIKKESGTVKTTIKEFPTLMGAFGNKTTDTRLKVSGLKNEINDTAERISKYLEPHLRETRKELQDTINEIESSYGLTFGGSVDNFNDLEKFSNELLEKIVSESVSSTPSAPTTPTGGSTGTVGATGTAGTTSAPTTPTGGSTGTVGATGTAGTTSAPTTPTGGTTGPVNANAINDLNIYIKKLNEGKISIANFIKAAKSKGIYLKDEDIRPYIELTYKIDEARQAFVELTAAQKEFVDENRQLHEAGTESIKAGINEAKSGFGTMVKFAKDFLGVWGKIDQAASKFSKSIGVGAHGMEAMRKGAIDLVARGSFASKYNVSAEDLMGMASKYKTETGRNIALDTEDLRNMAAMSATFQDAGIAAQFGAQLQNYGISLERSGQIAGRMFKEAGKYGVSFEKTSRNFMNNIKVAQSYSFRNGVRDLETMARKSAEIKLDMQQIVRLAERLTEGGVQTAVETGAKLQVLGGPFAQMSDPLQMLNEGLNDPKALMDRFIRMTRGLGYYDAKKGEFNTSTFDKMRLRAASKAMEMDYNQVMESVNAQAKNEFVRRQISQVPQLAGLSEEDKAFLANTASVKNGKAEFSYVDSKTKQIVTATTSTLTSDFLKQYKLQNQSETDDIKDIATMLRGWDDSIMGMKKQVDNTKAQAVEASGLGVKAKSVVQLVGDTNALVNTIVGYMAILTAATLFNSLRNAGRFFSVGKEARGIANANTGGSVPRGSIAPGAGGSGGSGAAAGGTLRPVVSTPPGTVAPTPAPSVNASVSTATGAVANGTGRVSAKQFNAADGSKWIQEPDGKFHNYKNGVPTGKKPQTLNQVNSWANPKPKVSASNISSRNAQAAYQSSTGTAGTGGNTSAAKAIKGGKLSFRATPKVAGLGMGLGIAGSVGNMLMAQGRYSGAIKKGGFGDFAGSMASTAGEYAGLGSLFGLPGLLIGAAAGLGVGAYNAERRRRERKIAEAMGGEGMGVAEGKYSNVQLKKIRKAIETGDESYISQKLKAKMEANGDSHIFERIKEMKSNRFSAESLTTDRSTIDTAIINKMVYSNNGTIPQAAGGAVVSRGISGKDTELYRLSKNEVVLNPEQQANAFFNIANMKPVVNIPNQGNIVLSPTQNRNLVNNLSNVSSIGPSRITLNVPTYGDFTSNVYSTSNIGDRKLRVNKSDTRFGNVINNEYLNKTSNGRILNSVNSSNNRNNVINTRVSPRVSSNITNTGDVVNGEYLSSIRNSQVLNNGNYRVSDARRYKDGGVNNITNTSTNPRVNNTVSRFGDIVKGNRNQVSSYSYVRTLPLVEPIEVKSPVSKASNITNSSTLTNNSYTTNGSIVNGQSFVRESIPAMVTAPTIKPITEISPRQMDINKVLPKVEPSAPKVVEHKISDLKISLDVNGNSGGSFDFGRMLADELRKNPTLLHNLANKISEQIGINEDGGRVVKRFSLT